MVHVALLLTSLTGFWWYDYSAYSAGFDEVGSARGVFLEGRLSTTTFFVASCMLYIQHCRAAALGDNQGVRMSETVGTGEGAMI